MKAAFYEKKGPAQDVLQVADIAVPQPAAGEVRVRIHVSAVNPSDTKQRGGARGNIQMPFARVIPHQDGAGVIDAVGSGVPTSRVGERVWVYEATLGRPQGTAAQFSCVPAQKAVPLPANADFIAGACMGIPAMTAHRCVFADGPISGQNVLVQGGAGAVGYYAIQMAKLGGAAKVIATVSRDEQAQRAREAGADAIINYRSENLTERIAQICGNSIAIDRVIEVAFGANLASNLTITKPGAVIATYSSDAAPEPSIPFWPLLQKDITVRFVLVYAMSAQAHTDAAQWISLALSHGQLKHQVHQVYKLDEIAQAHLATESMKHVGKVLIQID